MTDDKPRKQKKSETLEVRLPHETKQAFLTACRDDGTTASEVVRESIDTYLDERGRPAVQPVTGNILAMIPKPLRRPRIALGAAGAVGLAALAILPSAAQPDFKTLFDRMDANKDGVISAEEFAGGRGGDDVKTENVVVMRSHSETKDGAAATPAPQPSSETKEEAYTFWLPGEDAGASDVQQHSYQVVQRREVRVTTDGQKPEPQVTVITHDDIRKKEFTAFDKDGDGKVSFAEFEARQKAMLTRGFELLDTDGDKSLTEAEYAKIGTPVMPKLGAGAPDIPAVQIPSRITPEQVKAYFTKLDKNGDKRLSLQEYLPPA